MPRQGCDHIVGNLFFLVPLFQCKILQKPTDQERDILFPVAQGGDPERDDVQAIVEILAKPPLFHLFFKILVGRRQHPDIGCNQPVPSDTFERLLLEDPKHFCLRLKAHVGHFVKKDRPLVGQVKLSPFHGGRPGKGPLFMAEQLALNQIFRNRRTVHLDERFLDPPALTVNGSGHELLSRSVFSHDQDPGVGRRDNADHLFEVQNRTAVPRQLIFVTDLLAEEQVFLFQTNNVHRMVDHQNHLLERERFLDEIEGPEFGRLHRGFDRAVARHHDNLEMGMRGLDRLENLDSIHAWKPDVQDNQIGRFLFQNPQSLLTACGRNNRVPFVGQDSPEGFADALFIVHNQNGLVHGFLSFLWGHLAARCPRRAPLSPL